MYSLANRFMKAALTLAVLFACHSGPAATLYVNCQTGNDKNDGTEAKPLATIKAAIEGAKTGDTIKLLPAGALYRESMIFDDKEGLTVDGNGVTLVGTDPAAPDAWEQVIAPDIHRVKVKRVFHDACMVVLNGKIMPIDSATTETQSLPAPEKIPAGKLYYGISFVREVRET